MVHYLYKKEDRKAYVRSCVWNNSKWLFIIAMISALIGVVFLSGFLSEEKTIDKHYVILSFVGFVAYLFYGIESTVEINKYFNRLFQYADENGNVEGSICVENDEFVVEETSEKFVERIGIEYIKGIRVCGKCIIVFCPAEPLYLPKTDELIAFLEPYKKR